MKYIVSFSGGAGSFIAAKRTAEKYGADNVVLVFCDTLIEDEDLYRFIDDCVDYLGCEYIRLAKGETPWDVYERKKWMGNSRTAHCSYELKGSVFKDWLFATYQPDACALVFGFDWNEEHRHKEAAKNWGEYQVISPLLEPPYLEKKQMLVEIQSLGIAVPTARPFLRKTVNGNTEYLTLRQFRESLQRNEQYDLFDFGGCGCFSDAGGAQ